MNKQTRHYRRAVFNTYFLVCQSTGPTSSISMFISQFFSAIRADCSVIFSQIVSPDEGLSAIGRRTDVNFEHCRVTNVDKF